MATKTNVMLVDDLSNEPADTTVAFGLDGRDYEIDLTDANEVFSPGSAVE